jgi:hypothetical protein
MAATADGSGAPNFLSYPGAVNPLQIDELLPDGKQYSQHKDGHTDSKGTLVVV